MLDLFIDNKFVLFGGLVFQQTINPNNLVVKFRIPPIATLTPGWQRSKLKTNYNKSENFTFHIHVVNFPFISITIPTASPYGVYISNGNGPFLFYVDFFHQRQDY